jgi:hypothetical protein
MNALLYDSSSLLTVLAFSTSTSRRKLVDPRLLHPIRAILTYQQAPAHSKITISVCKREGITSLSENPVIIGGPPKDL